MATTASLSSSVRHRTADEVPRSSRRDWHLDWSRDELQFVRDVCESIIAASKGKIPWHELEESAADRVRRIDTDESLTTQAGLPTPNSYRTTRTKTRREPRDHSEDPSDTTLAPFHEARKEETRNQEEMDQPGLAFQAKDSKLMLWCETLRWELKRKNVQISFKVCLAWTEDI